MKNHESKFSLLAICSDVGRVVWNVCICIMDRMMPFYSLEGSHQVLDIILPHRDFTVRMKIYVIYRYVSVNVTTTVAMMGWLV